MNSNKIKVRRVKVNNFYYKSHYFYYNFVLLYYALIVRKYYCSLFLMVSCKKSFIAVHDYFIFNIDVNELLILF